MITLWLCVAAVLAASPAHGEDIVHVLRLYPAPNSTLAGVIQVSRMDDQQQPQYAYNASQARELCERLGLAIATKAQVQEALNRGLETCRFGWVDEQIAVVPRINSRKICGQGGEGVVTWRADVAKEFDVFCFNSSAEGTEPRNYTTEEIVKSVNVVTEVMMLQEAELSARLVGSEERSSGGKAVLITAGCGLFLVAVIVVVYLKLRRRRTDPQQEDMEAE
ncbi:lymphatic vessel endothelial hyaluronic acid receptor 1a isoform 1-T1 [Synchiropus picturatus]